MRYSGVLANVISVVLFSTIGFAQAPSLTVTSATININPASTDSYDLQGSFSGLSLNGASFVQLTVGSFSSSIPLANFVQQPGTNIFVYQDSTGQTPAWVSTLTLNMDAQTFEAQTSGIVLAGLSNPFALQLGTDQAAGCTMLRVNQVTPGTYQLNAGDPQGMTCEMAIPPAALPNVVMAGSPTNVTVDLSPVSLTSGDTLQNIQLFMADDNAQPIGDPLCTLLSGPAGDFGCMVSINQSTPSVIPLVVAATVAGQTTLSSGFSIRVAGPPTDDDVAQLSAIENGMIASDAFFAQYGDTAYARIQTMQSLRALMAVPVSLTGQPVGMALDGLSIYVRANCGLPVVMSLDDLGSALSADAKASIKARPHRARPIGPMVTRHHLPVSRSRAEAGLEPMTSPPAGGPAPLACGSFQRDIVQNNQVLVWSPGDFFGFTGYNAISQVLESAMCPQFQFNPSQGLILGAATVASLNQFPNYGTIIMNSHGGIDDTADFLVTGEASARNSDDLAGALGIEGTGCVNVVALVGPDDAIIPAHRGCFKTVYPNHPNVHPLAGTVIYAGFCYSIDGSAASFKWAWAPPLPPPYVSSAYYGYHCFSFNNDDFNYGVPVFQALTNQYVSASEAFEAAPPSVIDTCPGCGSGAHFEFFGNENLAYIGNPKLVSLEGNPVAASRGAHRKAAVGPRTTAPSPPATPPPSPPLSMNMLDPALNLEAQLDGADSCQLTYQWSNTAIAGHLTSSIAGGPQDNFTSASQDASYTPLNPPTRINSINVAKDNLMVDFLPILTNPPAARACNSVNVIVPLSVSEQQVVAYDASHPESVPPPTDSAIPIGTSGYTAADAGTYAAMGASANVAVTNNGKSSWTVTGAVSGANPTPGSGAGPYEGELRFNLLAVNPPQKGQTTSHITISGKLTNSTSASSFPDGQVYITDAQGNATTYSLYPGDMGTPFSVTVDSTASMANPVSIYLGINANAPAGGGTYTATLSIQFLNP